MMQSAMQSSASLTRMALGTWKTCVRACVCVSDCSLPVLCIMCSAELYAVQTEATHYFSQHFLILLLFFPIRSSKFIFSFLKFGVRKIKKDSNVFLNIKGIPTKIRHKRYRCLTIQKTTQEQTKCGPLNTHAC